ncbi:MAG: trimethylamine methyltransferase family protein [Anaerolineales bacterium]|nr:MAG: trimethylamine methyltransferase family protein [Anaerolineales bacterium]
MLSTYQVKPRLSLLSAENIQDLHHYALKILSKTGVRVDSKPVRDMLAARLSPAMVNEDIIRLPSDLVEWALQSAPHVIDIHDRRGQLLFQLGADRHRFGIGVTALYYQDPLTDRLTPFGRKNMQEIVRLGGKLPLYDVISTVGVVQDVPPAVSDLYATLDMVANTIKPLVILISDESKFQSVLDLLEEVHGDLAHKPFVIPYFNPVSPLVMNEGTLDKMRLASERGLPYIISNYGMCGMSTPLTPAGTLAQLLAELLAGLVISQVIKEGAPVILGMLPAYFEMKTMINFYDSQSMLMNLACAELMAYYQLPWCGTSGSGTGWGPDLLAVETYWMNHLTVTMTKGGLSPFVGDTQTSKAFSATNTVYVHEIIRQSLDYAGGIRLDEESVGLDEIHAAGPGGHYLTSPTTLENYKSAYYSSPIFPRYSMETWEQKGHPAAIDVLRQYTLQLLKDLQAPEDHDEIMAEGERFIQNLA